MRFDYVDVVEGCQCAWCGEKLEASAVANSMVDDDRAYCSEACCEVAYRDEDDWRIVS
jgi:hypothetical protein